MTATKLARYERRLLQERSRARHDLRSVELELIDGPVEVDADVATLESAELQEIDDALRILYRTPGAFGKCEVCGKAISDLRLELLPASRLCSRHARRSGRRG